MQEEKDLIVPYKFIAAIRKESSKTQVLWMRWLFYGKELKNIDIVRRLCIDTPTVTEKEITDIYNWGMNHLKDSCFFNSNVQNTNTDIEALTQRVSDLESKVSEIAEKLNNKDKGRPASNPNSPEIKFIEEIKEVIDYFNQVCGTSYSEKTPKNKLIIASRLNEGWKKEDLLSVIDKKSREWKGNRMEKYLRPITIFNQSKFESYVNQKETVNNTIFNIQNATDKAKEYFTGSQNG